jgi:DNA-binding NarL/FixJ family response regulator
VSAPSVRVVLAEDDLIVREGVQHLIAGLDGMDVVDAVGDLPAVEEAVERLKPDVVVTDIRLPPSLTDEGLRLARTLRERHPEVGVVVLTQHAEPEYARTLMEAGGSGRAYLLKERVTDRGQLESAIRTVVAGGTYVDSAVVERVLAASAERTSDRVDALTPREIQVIGLIAQAKSNEAVARELNISTRAVERHVNAIFSRLQIEQSPDVSRRVMAVLVYLEDLRRRESSDQQAVG